MNCPFPTNYDVFVRSPYHRPIKRLWGTQERLWFAGFRTFNPTCLERRFLSRFRRHKTIERQLFPGYLFVEHLPEAGPWQRLLDERAVISVVRGAGLEEPAAVDARVMKRLLEIGKGGPVKDDRWMLAFAPGQRVTVNEGPWAGHTGTVETSTEDRVSMLLSIFGRETRAHFPADVLQVA